MTALVFLAFFCAFLFMVLSIILGIQLHRSRKDFSSLENEAHYAVGLAEKLKDEKRALEEKFQKNPSYECQQLLANLLSGHALFHIETIDPENIFIRRR